MWPIERLKPHPANAREHSQEQVEQIGRSIVEFGVTHAILADEDGTMLGGHGIRLGAMHVGLKEVPVTVISGLTDEQKRVYLILDNQLGLNSTWDEEKLRLALETLERELVDLNKTCMDPRELDRLLADLAPERDFIDEDAVPEPTVVPVTVRGDLINLGRHWILCDDATRSESYDRVLQGGSANMAFCDPPFSISYTQKSTGKKITNDNLGSGFPDFLEQACTQILSATKGAVYVCMSSSELHTLYKAFTRSGGHWSTYIIWAKDRFTFGRSDLQRAYEVVLYGWKEGNSHFFCGARNQGDVWHVPKPKANRLHPTMKPVALVERAIRNSSQRGDLVLDAFGGAGSTLIACEKTGRRAAIIEIEPKYVDVMIRRWQAYTGGEARFEDGKSFAAVANQRSRRAA
jgi:DNA modification methylase